MISLEEILRRIDDTLHLRGKVFIEDVPMNVLLYVDDPILRKLYPTFSGKFVKEVDISEKPIDRVYYIYNHNKDKFSLEEVAIITNDNMILSIYYLDDTFMRVQYTKFSVTHGNSILEPGEVIGTSRSNSFRYFRENLELTYTDEKSFLIDPHTAFSSISLNLDYKIAYVAGKAILYVENTDFGKKESIDLDFIIHQLNKGLKDLLRKKEFYEKLILDFLLSAEYKDHENNINLEPGFSHQLYETHLL